MASKPPTPSGSGPSDPAHTTFVQADPSTFRALVQKLTGAAEDSSTEKLPVSTHPTRVNEMGPRRPAFKLQERRQGARKLEISLASSNGQSNCNNRYRWVKGGVLGGEGGVVVSPVSPFDALSSRGSASPRTPLDEEMEERAIAGKGFYLHPSPISAPRGADPPELLPLFPLQSPRDPNKPS